MTEEGYRNIRANTLHLDVPVRVTITWMYGWFGPGDKHTDEVDLIVDECFIPDLMVGLCSGERDLTLAEGWHDTGVSTEVHLARQKDERDSTCPECKCRNTEPLGYGQVHKEWECYDCGTTYKVEQ